MVKYIKQYDKNNNTQTKEQENDTNQHNKSTFGDSGYQNIKISCSLTENLNKIKGIIGANTDLVIRNITVGRSEARSAAVIYLVDMIDTIQIDENIMRPLVLDAYTSGLNSSSEIIEQLQAGNVLTRGRVKTGRYLKDLIDAVLVGEACLLIDGVDEVYIISTKGINHRNVSESDVEPVVTGPREAFVEVLSINLGLIRRRIRHPNLIFESLSVGTIGKTEVVISYIKGICPDGLSDEVRSRIKRIKIDDVLGSSYIEELIEDNPYSLFPQMRNTERPDVVAAALLEGRVAILVENTPVTLIAPGEFFSLMQSAEDYYNRYWFSSMIRYIRYFAFIISIFLPAVYIAVTTFHQEMIPTAMLISIISARSEVPIPVFIEAFSMIITFEILHEAGVRLPRPIGQAVSIVGALVIGQAAVQAKIVSPLMVIVIALTAISKFSMAQYNITMSIRILRLLFMLLSSILGMFGIMAGILFLMLHLFSMESFGKPYMTPFSPLRIGDLKDTAMRAPWWAMIRRPAYSSLDPKRMGSGQIPHPPKKKEGQS